MDIGRPPIGPKKQASIPQKVADWIEEERQRRGERHESTIVRELVIAGYERLTGGDA